MEMENRSKTLVMRVTPSTLKAFRSLKWGTQRYSDADLLEGLMKLLVSTNSLGDMKFALTKTRLGSYAYDAMITIDLMKCHPMSGSYEVNCNTSLECNT